MRATGGARWLAAIIIAVLAGMFLPASQANASTTIGQPNTVRGSCTIERHNDFDIHIRAEAQYTYRIDLAHPRKHRQFRLKWAMATASKKIGGHYSLDDSTKVGISYYTVLGNRTTKRASTFSPFGDAILAPDSRYYDETVYDGVLVVRGEVPGGKSCTIAMGTPERVPLHKFHPHMVHSFAHCDMPVHGTTIRVNVHAEWSFYHSPDGNDAFALEYVRTSAASGDWFHGWKTTTGVTRDVSFYVVKINKGYVHLARSGVNRIPDFGYVLFPRKTTNAYVQVTAFDEDSYICSAYIKLPKG